MRMISKDCPTVGKLYRNRGRAFMCDHATLGTDDCVLVLAYSDCHGEAGRIETEVTMLVTKMGVVSVGSYVPMVYSSAHWSFWWEEL
jgi:hypothetical protein